jgi:hypothetical protein
MKDSYEDFISHFGISRDKFFEYGLQAMISVSTATTKAYWEKLVNDIANKNPVTIRSFGRNGKGSVYFQEFIHFALGIDIADIHIDPSNNTEPTRMLEEATGYHKEGPTRDIQNYQVSHIFGKVKNPYMFVNPWNVVWMPKLFDPFTGHESSTNWSLPFQEVLQKQIISQFRPFIVEYNDIMDSLNIPEKILLFSKEHSDYFKGQSNLREEIQKDFGKIPL